MQPRKTGRARRDLIDIWNTIAEDNRDAATRLLRKIDDKIRMLAGHPESGRLRTDIGADVRAFPVGSYLILYRATAAGVEIVRVIHGARDLGDLLDD